MLPSPLIDALFRSVFEAPNDLARRHALADALMEQGDVRGEFIALQLSTATLAKKRAAKLAKRHAQALLGPLARVVTNPVFARGFLESCTLQLDGQLTHEPRWATVRHVELILEPVQLPLELASPWMKSLERVSLRWPRSRVRHNAERIVSLVREALRAGGREHLLRLAPARCH